MSRVYISDANILIDFRNAGLLEELFRLPFALCCTDFVLRELRGLGRPELEGMGLLIEAMDGPAVLRLFELRTRNNNSSLADVSCYLLAQETGHPLLTGDGQLRRQARKDGITVHGALCAAGSIAGSRSHPAQPRIRSLGSYAEVRRSAPTGGV